MIKLAPDTMIDNADFDVYDSIGKMLLSPEDVAEDEYPEDRRLVQLTDGFCIDWEGGLWLTLANGETHMVQKNGNYVIAFSSGRWMRW